MSPRPKSNTGGSSEICDYIRSVTLRESPILARLREETASYPESGMQVSPEQGQFLALLARLAGARQTLEVGVFTGYSSLCVASALPDDGKIIACDVNDEWTKVARRYWKEAAVDRKIDLHLRPALETLRQLLAEGRHNSFDFAFIDADKPNYQVYYETVLKLIRPGGLIVADNVLWSGRVLDPAVQDESTQALRKFNETVGADDRVWITLVPIGDGLMLAQKK